jgi:hypothetical protein
MDEHQMTKVVSGVHAAHMPIHGNNGDIGKFKDSLDGGKHSQPSIKS